MIGLSSSPQLISLTSSAPLSPALVFGSVTVTDMLVPLAEIFDIVAPLPVLSLRLILPFGVPLKV